MPRTASSNAASGFVGAVIRTRRRELSLTQSELARRLEVSDAYVQKVERGGANLTVGQLDRFAEALGAILRVELTPLPVAEPVLAHLSADQQ